MIDRTEKKTAHRKEYKLSKAIVLRGDDKKPGDSVSLTEDQATRLRKAGCIS